MWNPRACRYTYIVFAYSYCYSYVYPYPTDSYTHSYGDLDLNAYSYCYSYVYPRPTDSYAHSYGDPDLNAYGCANVYGFTYCDRHTYVGANSNDHAHAGDGTRKWSGRRASQSHCLYPDGGGGG